VGAVYFGTFAEAIIEATCGSLSRGLSRKVVTLLTRRARRSRLAAMVKARVIDCLSQKGDLVRNCSYIMGNSKVISTRINVHRAVESRTCQEM